MLQKTLYICLTKNINEMKNKEEYHVELEGVDLTILGHLDGVYIAETRFEPAEYPDFYIDSIKVVDSDINIYKLISEKQLCIINETISEKWMQ